MWQGLNLYRGQSQTHGLRVGQSSMNDAAADLEAQMRLELKSQLHMGLQTNLWLKMGPK